ncbi:histidinol-phosphate transaminase [Waterburya agarophytonicola K14]|uniref:Histidinol-phosphate aminotransferase n=1 Tax=Waterburya agarophytonicola KI4 TaxID=2874699 RepID=A0A964BTR8_9CYAN|nr:histidinol-phosphate transaminase [Waterburya agarophytonicola]MCC0178974.1 histidinol-phosphate transaminase [Waterburya agarophytonicola KI4]
MNYFRPTIALMEGYTPGEQPKPGTPIIKLNTNENPYPPSPLALEVLRNLDSEWLRRYPDPYSRDFCSAVSAALGVPKDWIIVTNGSDDLLNILIRSCAEGKERKVVYPMPSYVLYRTLSALQSAEAIEVDYPQDYQLPIDRLVAAGGAVTLIATPNSPSGHIVPLEDLRTLAREVSGILAIDEAYVDFADYSALSLVEEFDNVIILRTLSKGYSLAGLRLGFGIANPKLLSGLFKVKDSYNVDAIAILVGTAAMEDQDHKNSCAEKVKRSRFLLKKDLEQIGFAVRDSQGNFLLVTPPNNKAETIYQYLKENNILVRYFNLPGLNDKLRITVGTGEQNKKLLQSLDCFIY